MSESPHSLSQRSHPYLPGVWLAVGFLGLASLALLLRPLGVTPNTITESDAKARLEKLTKLRAEQDQLSSSYGWADKEKGIARIPISKAMEMTITSLRTNAPHAAYPITTIQPSAISAAGAPLYPEVPPVEPAKVAAAIAADGGSTAKTPASAKTNPPSIKP
jgi:hypothetical protein